MGINVLSLFDGISAGRVALERAGIVVDNYYASEVDKYAIQVSNKNYPDIKQMGDVTKWREWDIDWSSIDLVIGGSPCQGFSFAGKQLNFEDPRSKLFFDFVDICHRVADDNPKMNFLLENVRMKKEYQDVISSYMGIEPVMINSSLLAAQNRVRFYWVGQNIERTQFINNNICHKCNNKNESKKKLGISGETSTTRERTLLGEAQGGQINLYDLPQGVLKNRKEGYYKDLFNTMPSDKQKESRQESRQGETISIQNEILPKEQGSSTELPKGIQENNKREGSDEKSRSKSPTEIGKTNADTLAKTAWSEKEDVKRGINGGTEDGESLCCLQCNTRFNNRPHSTYIMWRDKRIEKFTGVMSEMQFNQIHQNNGRIFDTYQINIGQPEDKGIILKDIILDQDEVDEKYYLTAEAVDYMSRLRNGKPRWEYHKNPIDGKAACLTANMYKGVPYGVLRIPEATKKGYVELNENEGIDLTHFTSKTRRGRLMKDKSNCLTVNGFEYAWYDGYICRKLTPLECERLQTFPDQYTSGVSNTQRYKALGNSWTVDIIAHIFKQLK